MSKDIEKTISSWNKRLSWDEYFISSALLIASRSSCHRLHVGCLLVKDNRIISAGYNGFLAGLPHESVVVNNHEQNTVHAEQNAISDCAKRGVNTNGATAYITHYPCIICCRLLLAGGINNIYYINDYKNDELVPYFSKIAKVNVEKI